MAVVLTDIQRDSIRHVVYEYAHLVSSFNLLCAPEPKRLTPPAIFHIQDAFLIGCRKMAEFFQPSDPDDVAARAYLPLVGFKLPVWRSWSRAIDKQLAHLTYTRESDPKTWDGSAVGPLFVELQGAWQKFIAGLDSSVRAEFDSRIGARLQDIGYEKLNLY